MRLDGVDAVTIGTHRRLEVAALDPLPVDALHILLPHVVVALGAGGRHVGFVDARFRIVRRTDLMAAVAVGADRGLGGTSGHRFAVDALLVVDESGRTQALFLHHEFLTVAGAAGGRDIAMRDFGLGVARRQDLVWSTVAGGAGRGVRISLRPGLGMDAEEIAMVGISVALGARHLQRRHFVRR